MGVEVERLMNLLMRAGLKKNIAKSLAYMVNREEVTSREIEKEMGLRQPEVSIAMQWLRKRGWVVKRDVKKEGKGRPVHAYKLAKPFSQILSEIIREIEAKIDEDRKVVEELKKFAQAS